LEGNAAGFGVAIVPVFLSFHSPAGATFQYFGVVWQGHLSQSSRKDRSLAVKAQCPVKAHINMECKTAGLL